MVEMRNRITGTVASFPDATVLDKNWVRIGQASNTVVKAEETVTEKPKSKPRKRPATVKK